MKFESTLKRILISFSQLPKRWRGIMASELDFIRNFGAHCAKVLAGRSSAASAATW